ncbi:MAG: hypothetical protein IH940_01695 [Acidobacteria bacterium]|nr:hypothetical protein [Acidobacteriota bacterium]
MLTTGFKLFFGLFVAATFGAVVLGYTSGGNHLGPVTFGYKGSVGFVFGYTVLMVAGFASGAVGLLLQAFRDGDAEAAAQLLGTDTAPVGQTPLGDSMWPLIGAVAAGTTVVGLVVHPAVMGVGLILGILTMFEWTMSAWADRATGDPQANRELRDSVMRPIELPALALGAVALMVASVSRVFLASSANGAVLAATILALVIIGIAVLFATKPKVSKNVATAVVLIVAFGVLVTGTIAAVVGERDFEHSSDESRESEEGTSDGSSTDSEGDGSHKTDAGAEGEASDE